MEMDKETLQKKLENMDDNQIAKTVYYLLGYYGAKQKSDLSTKHERVAAESFFEILNDGIDIVTK